MNLRCPSLASIFILSDISVKVPNRIIPAHKIVLAARSNDWSDENLLETSSLGMHVEILVIICQNSNTSSYFIILIRDSMVLDWTDMSSEIGVTLLKWIYTDQVDFSRGENFTLDLMKVANVYHLNDLISK